jgi:hypothetical protein
MFKNIGSLCKLSFQLGDTWTSLYVEYYRIRKCVVVHFLFGLLLLLKRCRLGLPILLVVFLLCGRSINKGTCTKWGAFIRVVNCLDLEGFGASNCQLLNTIVSIVVPHKFPLPFSQILPQSPQISISIF